MIDYDNWEKLVDIVLLKEMNSLWDIIENNLDWIWEVDVVGCYMFLFVKFIELLGCFFYEVIGKILFDFMFKDEVYWVGKLFVEIVVECIFFVGL